MDALTHLWLGALAGSLGLSLVGGHVRPGMNFAAAAVEMTKDRNDWAVKRLRNMHRRSPAVNRWMGWLLFWWAVWSFTYGLLQLFGAQT
jgi:hypothetical protein